MLLLGKAVLVAIYSKDDLFPRGERGEVGLAFMFCSILCSALFLGLEALVVVQIIAGARIPWMLAWIILSLCGPFH